MLDATMAESAMEIRRIKNKRVIERVIKGSVEEDKNVE